MCDQLAFLVHKLIFSLFCTQFVIDKFTVSGLETPSAAHAELLNQHSELVSVASDGTALYVYNGVDCTLSRVGSGFHSSLAGELLAQNTDVKALLKRLKKERKEGFAKTAATAAAAAGSKSAENHDNSDHSSGDNSDTDGTQPTTDNSAEKSGATAIAPGNVECSAEGSNSSSSADIVSAEDITVDVLSVLPAAADETATDNSNNNSSNDKTVVPVASFVGTAQQENGDENDDEEDEDAAEPETPVEEGGQENSESNQVTSGDAAATAVPTSYPAFEEEDGCASEIVLSENNMVASMEEDNDSRQSVLVKISYDLRESK